MGSFVEFLSLPLPTSMRWANMKSKWKSSTKGWKKDDKSLDGCVRRKGWGGGSRGDLFLHPWPQKHQVPQFHEKSPYEDLAVPPALD